MPLKDKLIKGKDYCTNFPDSILGKSYAYCCYIHDVHYSNQPVALEMTRLIADNMLFKCVRKKRGLLVATLIWLGVRIFGAKYYKRTE